MRKVFSTKNRVFISLVDPSEAGKLQLVYNWLKIGTFRKNFDKIYFSYQNSQPLYNVMQKEIENLEIVRGVNFEFIDSLKNNGTKYLLVFDNSCENNCISKAFVDIATVRRHWGLSTFYIKDNLFHRSKPGRDVVLQNTHIVLFKYPRDLMQVTTLSTQLGFGSELVDWYWDATSVPFGHLSIDLSPGTDDRLRCCTNTGSIPSKFYIPERLEQSKISVDEHTKSLFFPSVQAFQSFSHKCKCLFLESWPKESKEFIWFPCGCIQKSAQMETCRAKKTSRGTISKRSSTIVCKTYNLEAKNRHSGVRRRVTAH